MTEREALAPAGHGQGWILDQMVRLTRSEDVLHPGIMGIRLERGFIYGDMQRVFDRVLSARSYPRAWEQEAVRQEGLGRQAEDAQRSVTAAQHFHRASLYYGRAAHLTPGDNPAKVERYRKVRSSYDRMRFHMGSAITHHELSMPTGEPIFALFHRAPGDGPKPTILYIPGMDAMKEDYPSPFLNDFVRRGMNVIAMDGPGQGEALAHGTKVTPSNYADAVTAVLDFAVALPEVDANRIGCFGTSMGTYWSVLGAAADGRIRALAGQMPNVGTKDVIFRQAQPNFRRIYKFMAGYDSEAQMDDAIPVMDRLLEEAGQNLTAPYLLVGGDLDELTPVNHIHEWFERLTCPKELWIYQDVFHPMGEVVAEAYPAIADWLFEALDGRLSTTHREVRTIDLCGTVAPQQGGVSVTAKGVDA